MNKILVLCFCLSTGVAWASGQLRITVPASAVTIEMAAPVVSIQPRRLPNVPPEWSFDFLNAGQMVQIEVLNPDASIEKFSFTQRLEVEEVLGASSSRSPSQKADRVAWGLFVNQLKVYQGDVLDLRGTGSYIGPDVKPVRERAEKRLVAERASFEKRLNQAKAKGGRVVLVLPLGSENAALEYPQDSKAP